VGEGLHLAPAGQPLPLEQLKSIVGPENITDRAVEHRARVARHLFGLTDPARYRNLLHLLHRLRRPTIGDRIDSGGLVSVLAGRQPGGGGRTRRSCGRGCPHQSAARRLAL
jgi:hypothetical protein